MALKFGIKKKRSTKFALIVSEDKMVYPKVVLSLITGPIRTDVAQFDNSGRRVLTHLQKYSHFGFMLTWPFCFHFWLFWKLQEGSDQTGWKPGTEQGIYGRTPGKRWDTDLGMIRTWGYLGGHWD